MFFIIGISDNKKELDFAQSILCDKCSRYGRYTVFVTSTALTLFFIPVFSWNKRYYVQSSCCGRIYELESQMGKRIERGEQVQISDENLKEMGRAGVMKKCLSCGFSTEEDFEFCPKCGRRF